MKKETYQAKLAKLLGLTDVFEEVQEKKAKANTVPAITEDEIQDFRAAQGVVYFLQAPELFSLKVCKHCGEQFLVSRKFVALCSYTCIAKDLEARGIKWRRNEDFEALAKDPNVYDGNEPIWIRNIPQLKRALEHLTKSADADLSVPV